MPVDYCPKCTHWVDMDGFVEHGYATLYHDAVEDLMRRSHVRGS